MYPGLGAKSMKGSNSEEEKSGSKSKKSGSKATPLGSEPARARNVEL